MPVHNGEKYLDEAIQSVLSQTFSDFEFLIMDDGSTDRTPQILEFYAQKDPRIRIFHQQNSGVAHSGNALVSHARADLVARLDADDLLEPECLKTEYEYLQKHPGTVLLGAASRFLQPDGNQSQTSVTLREDFLIRWAMTFDSPFLQIGLMFRKSAFNACGGYLESEYPAEDYGLWRRIKQHGRVENLKKILGTYRINPDGITRNNYRRQTAMRNRISRLNLEDIYRYGEIPDLAQVNAALKNYEPQATRNEWLGKTACLTGCFLVEKGEIKHALQFFKWSFRTSKKRLDSLANQILAHFKSAMYISIDVSVRKKRRTIVPRLHWYKTAKQRTP